MADREQRPVTLTLAAVLLFLAMMFLLGDFRWGLPGSGLFDPDSYSRMLRVERLLSTGGWYDNAVPWANAPYGGPTLHWTRPLDIVIAAGAVPLSHFTSLRSAVVWGGSAMPIVLAIVLVFTVVWASRPYLGPRGLVALGFLLAAQPTLPQVFRWSYVDHHGLIVLLLAIGWAGTVRTFTSLSPRRAIVAGVAAGVALWVTVEALGWVGAAAGTLALLWVVEGDRRHLDALRRMLTAAAVTALVALLIERAPADLLSRELDRISLPYVIVLVLLAAAWNIVGRRSRVQSRGGRFAIAALAFVVAALLSIAIFPRLLGGPLAGIDARVLPLLFESNEEFTHFSPHNLLYLASLAGAIVPGLVAFFFSILHLRDRDDAVRRLSVLTLVFLGIFLPLTLYQWRWSTYVNVAATLPWALAVRAALRPGPAASDLRRTLRVPFALLLLFGHALVAVGFARANLAEKRRAYSASMTQPAMAADKPAAGMAPRFADAAPGLCSYGGLGEVLGRVAHRDPKRLIVMTEMYDGPRMVWQTGASVVSTPYHRNGAGILDTQAVLAGSGDAVSRTILARRGVDFIVICGSGNAMRKLWHDAPDGLAARLLRDQPPTWLHPVPLPSGLDLRVGVYRVAR